MKLSQLKNHLPALKEVGFVLENGTPVPAHYHITEIGLVNKHFIDCGGTLRRESLVSMQLWSASDVQHRLHPSKLLHIVELSEKKLDLPDAEIEVEYQQNTIGRFRLDFDGEKFVLGNKSTACLASDHCGVPVEKPLRQLADLPVKKAGCCAPESNCC